MSTKEDHIAFLADAIEKSIEERKEIVKERKELEVELAEFLSMVTRKVTQQANEFYAKGYESGRVKEQKQALDDKYAELTGKVYGHEPPEHGKPLQGNQNQFFVPSGYVSSTSDTGDEWDSD